MKTNVIKGNFTMAQIDEFSGRLGGMEATQSHILRSVNTIESLIKDVSEKSILHGSSIEAAHKRLDKVEPKIENLQETEDKRKGAWAVIVWIAGFVGTIMGLIGGYIAKFLGSI